MRGLGFAETVTTPAMAVVCSYLVVQVVQAKGVLQFIIHDGAGRWRR